MTVFTNYRIVGSNDFGVELTAVGDVDGDGIVDFAVGAPQWSNWTGNTWEGTAWLVSGADLAAADAADGVVDGIIQATNLNSFAASASYRFVAGQFNNLASNGAGTTLASGDVVGDSRPEIFIAHPDATRNVPGWGQVNVGKVYMVAPEDFAALDAADGNTDHQIDLGNTRLAGSYSYEFRGEATNPDLVFSAIIGGQAGASVGTVQDFWGDGKNEILIGDPRWEHSPTVGNTYLHVGNYYPGDSAGVLYVIDSSAIAAADADGSGIYDRQVDLEDTARYGQTYRINGGWAGADNPNGDPMTWAGVGSAVAAGDVLGDSRADILVGAGDSTMTGIHSGAVWLAAPGALEDHWGYSPDGQKTVNLNADWIADTNGDGNSNRNWYTISGEKDGDHLAGTQDSLDAGADLDGDGRADMLMGAHLYDWAPGGTLHVPASANMPQAGAAYLVASSELSVIDGNNDHFIKLQDIVDRNLPGDPYPSLNTQYSYKFLGEEAYDRAGTAVKMIGDVTGDGVPDLLIGAPGTGANPGKAYLISGGALDQLDAVNLHPLYGGWDQLIYLGDVAGVGGSYKFVGTTIDVFGDGTVITGDYAGTSFADLGDMDGDGRTDFAIGTGIGGRSYIIGSTDLYNLDAVDGSVDGVIHLENVPYEPEVTVYDAIRTWVPISGFPYTTPLTVSEGELETVVEPITFQAATHGKLSEGDTTTIGGVDYYIHNIADGKGVATLDGPAGGSDTTKAMNFTALRLRPVVPGSGSEFTLIVPDDPDGDFARIKSLAVQSVNSTPSKVPAWLVDGNDLVTLVCFAAGTRILTRRGEVPVERLRVGDEVLTLDHGFQPLRWVGSTRVAVTARTAPVRIRAGVLGNDADLIVSPQHRMLLRSPTAELMFGEHEVLVAARHLVDGERVDRVSGGIVSYYHLLFDSHEIIFANGAPTESLYPAPEVVAELPAPMRQALQAHLPALAEGRIPEGFGRLARIALRGSEARLLWREMRRLGEVLPRRELAAGYAFAR